MSPFPKQPLFRLTGYLTAVLIALCFAAGADAATALPPASTPEVFSMPPPPPAPRIPASPAAEYLSQAKAAAVQITLPGDQSMALQQIALTMVDSDPIGAVDLAARMRRPSDAARVLGAISAQILQTDPASASQNIVTAGRLLLRIPGTDQRLMEQRLLLREIAALGEAALPAGPELTPGDAQLQIVLGRAESDPSAALALLRKWQLRDAAYDQAAGAIAEHLAVSRPDDAIDLATTIVSARLRESALWRIAELRPPQEAIGIVTRVSDPVVQSAVLRSAALRLAAASRSQKTEGADSPPRESNIPIAATSATAELAVALAATDDERALAEARALPELAKTWAIQRIAVALASSKPAVATNLLRDLRVPSDALYLVAAAIAKTDAESAISFARSLPPGDARDSSLSVVASSLARSNPSKATQLFWDMGPSTWRDRAVAAVAPATATSDLDQATSAIGLVTDSAQAQRIRALVAVSIAGRSPDSAYRILNLLPPSEARTVGGLDAAVAVLAASGQPDVAIKFGSLGLERDLAIRWMMPDLAHSQTRSPVGLAGEIDSPFLRSLAFVDIARELLDSTPRPRPAPDRAMQIRPIVEWEDVQ